MTESSYTRTIITCGFRKTDCGLFSCFPHENCDFDNRVQKPTVATGGQDGKVSSEDEEKGADE